MRKVAHRCNVCKWGEECAHTASHLCRGSALESRPWRTRCHSVHPVLMLTSCHTSYVQVSTSLWAGGCTAHHAFSQPVPKINLSDFITNSRSLSLIALPSQKNIFVAYTPKPYLTATDILKIGSTSPMVQMYQTHMSGGQVKKMITTQSNKIT